jgi:hypothetical protein
MVVHMASLRVGVVMAENIQVRLAEGPLQGQVQKAMKLRSRDAFGETLNNRTRQEGMGEGGAGAVTRDIGK